MDSPRQPKGGNRNREAKRGQNHSMTPPPKDAYARLLSQHHSSKFRSYLEQYAQGFSLQGEDNGPTAALGAYNDRPDGPQWRRDQALIDSPDCSDISLPSPFKCKGENSSLALYMEKLNSRGAWQDCDRKQQAMSGNSRQRHGERRDTATSQDGDVESGEEFASPKPRDSQQHQKQKRNKDLHRDGALSHQGSASPMKTSCSGQEQEKKKSRKKKNVPKNQEEENRRDGVMMSAAVDADIQALKSPHSKGINMQQVAQACGSPADKNNKNGRGSKKQIFESYMTSEDVSHGLKRGQLIQGPLRINAKKYQEAFLPSPDGTRDIFLDGTVARNRALNGDIVVVQVLPRDQWKVVKSDTDCEGAGESQVKAEQLPSPDVIVEDQYSDHNEVINRVKSMSLGAKDNGERGGHPEDPSTPRPNGEILQMTAKVVYIVEQKHSRAATGFLKFLPNKPIAMFAPVDHRVPRINVPLADCPADFSCRPGYYTNTLFICRITNWPSDNNFAQGRLAKTLGQAGEIEPETEGILIEYDVDFADFPDEVLGCLPQNLPWTIPPEELTKRRDLRKECIFTIDPATARDLDDALSCKPLPDGNFEVGVHIADVSYFVQEDNALDTMASKRATSVYMVQKVIPMLPRLLCEELCSLNPLTDRLTFSVIWTITPQGKILSEWFGRSVIRSCVKLSYDHAQCMIEAPDKMFSPGELPPVAPEHAIDQIHRAVLNMHAIAKSLRAQRFIDGALRLDRLKLSFTLDKETMMPQGCYVYQYRDSNKLVEEFMLLANIATAHHIYRAFPEKALLRRHPPPQAKMVEELQEFCDQMGLSVDFSSAGNLHRSLRDIFSDDEYATARKEVLTNMCFRPMQMAVYFGTGVVQDEALFKHYALNVPFYTHFTSPIRRYADVIVHRLLAASLGCGPRVSVTGEEIDKQASHCNDKKTASKRVQELSTELFFGVLVKECGPLDSEAMVMGVLDQSFDVLVLRYGVQKRIYCKSVEGLETFQHHKVGKKSELTLVWKSDDPEKPSERQIQVISLFTLVEVQLRADTVAMKYTALLKRPEEKAS